MSIRTARVNEEIRKVLSERLVRGLRDPLPGFVTIAAVEVTSDFSHAKVWVSVIGSDDEKREAVAVLQRNKGTLRSEVGRSVRLRQTPDLQFLFDEAGERAARVWQILEDEKRKASGSPSAAAPSAPTSSSNTSGVESLAAPEPEPRRRRAPAGDGPRAPRGGGRPAARGSGKGGGKKGTGAGRRRG